MSNAIEELETEEGAANGTPPEPDPPRKALTVAQIREAPPDCREDWLEVPEWGGWVKLRSPTALASAEIKSASIAFDTEGKEQGDDPDVKMDLPAMERAQVLHGVVDPVFSEADVAEFQQRFGPSFRRVIDALDNLGGPLSGKDGEAKLRRKAENTFRAG